MKWNGKYQAALAGLLVLTLAGCKGGGKGAPVPTQYDIGGESIDALTSSEKIKVTQSTSKDTEAAEYIYEGLGSPGVVVELYSQRLMAEESGFTVVNDELCKAEVPDFTAPEGAVRFAKAAAEEGRVVTVDVSWGEKECTVRVDTAEGAVRSAEDESQPMTIMEAIDYMKSLSPAVLGLEGNSMKDYKVYTENGAVLVDQYPCIRLNVYHDKNPEETNEVLGMYLLSADSRHLYRLDKESGTVEELKH